MPKGLVLAPTSDAFCTGIPPRHATCRVELEDRDIRQRVHESLTGDARGLGLLGRRCELDHAILQC
jgi:hypothetical protein